MEHIIASTLNPALKNSLGFAVLQSIALLQGTTAPTPMQAQQLATFFQVLPESLL